MRHRMHLLVPFGQFTARLGIRSKDSGPLTNTQMEGYSAYLGNCYLRNYPIGWILDHMSRLLAEQVDRELRSLIAEIVNAAIDEKSISRTELAERTNTARETLRRKIHAGDLSVPQLYSLAPHVDADAGVWLETIIAHAASVKESA